MRNIVLFLAIVCNLYAQEWVKVEPNFNPSGEYHLYHAAMGDENNLWFVDYESGRIFHTSDGGYNWIMQHDSIVPIPEYWDISFINSQTGWVLASTDSSTFILKTTDAGESWEKIETPYFHKIYFQNENNGTAAGSPGIYQTNNGGLTWEKSIYNEEEIPNGIKWVEQIVFFENGKGWIVLQPGNNWEGVKMIMESRDCGISWTEKRTNLSFQGLVDIFLIDSLNAHATTGLTSFFTTKDGGETWEIESSIGFHSIYFKTINVGWGSGGINPGLYQTTDGGNTWEMKLSLTNEFIKFLYKKNADKVYVVGPENTVYVCDLLDSVEHYEQNSSIDDFALYQNYPNPFNPTTKIRFEVFEADSFSLTLHDILGRRIKTLVSAYLTRNYYEVTVEKTLIASGIYFATLNNSKRSKTIKLILSR